MDFTLNSENVSYRFGLDHEILQWDHYISN
jgi:hypothetical protein